MKRPILRVALLGEGAQAARWASALSGLAEVAPPPEQLPGAVNALVIAPGARDPFAQAKEALLAGMPVLFAASYLLGPWQAAALDHLSRREGRLLRFVEPFQHRAGFAFLRRLLAGEEPFWRPLYLRALRVARPNGAVRIDELAAETLAMCQVLVNDAPRQVTAAAARRDETAEVEAAFLTVHYADGRLVQCTISLTEAVTASQLVVATPGRTIVLDEMDPVAPLRIMGGGEERLSPGEQGLVPCWQSRLAGLLAASRPDPVAEEARGFLDAVAAGDLSPANGERWARVAALWWAARQSMSFGGATEVPRPTFKARYMEPPPLKVIEGGGRTRPTARRPSLTVVAR